MPGKGNNKSSRSQRGQYEVVQTTALEYTPAEQPELPDHFDWHQLTVDYWKDLGKHPTMQNYTEAQWMHVLVTLVMPFDELVKKKESNVSVLRASEVLTSNAKEFVISPKSVTAAKLEFLTGAEIQQRLERQGNKAPARELKRSKRYDDLQIEG